MQQRLAGVFGAILSTVAIIGSANGGIITTYTSRTAFPGNDLLDWGQLGAPFTVVPAPFTVLSAGGLVIDVTQNQDAPFERRNQGFPEGGWAGQFEPGEHLLWKRFHSGEMDFSFLPIAGFGTAIESNAGGFFSATLSAFNGANRLGSITVSGNSSTPPPFAGITDSVAEITSIVITVLDGTGVLQGPGDFAIDSLSLLTPAAVPEPPSLIMLGSALLGLGCCIFARGQTFSRATALVSGPNTCA